MNVLFVTKGFPSAENPMSGNYEAVQAYALASMGHNVSVVYFRWKSLLHIFERRPIVCRTVRNVKIYEMDGFLPRLPFGNKWFESYKLDRWMRQLTAIHFSKKFMKKYSKPDIIHIHSQFIAKYAIVMKRVFDVPIVLTEHWSGLNLGHIDDNILSEKKVYLQSDAIIVVSHALQRSLKQYYGVESRVIHNMVDDNFFKNSCRTRKNVPFTFISVGRLVPVKCFDNLIKAFSLMNSNRDIRLLLIGDGPEREKIESMRNNLKLQNVSLMGLKTPKEISDLLCESDCFVLSSHRETFGIVLIEAMAKGLPVISTRCGGPDEFVNDSNGVLVEPDNPEELAKAMNYMVEHANDFDANKIRQYCIDHFSEEKIGQEIVKVYEGVLCKNVTSAKGN